MVPTLPNSNDKNLGGGSKDFSCSPRNPAEMVQFDQHIFLNGLVRPPTIFLVDNQKHTNLFETRRFGSNSDHPNPEIFLVAPIHLRSLQAFSCSGSSTH